MSGPRGPRSIPKGAFVPGGWYGYLVKLSRQSRQSQRAPCGLEEEEEEEESLIKVAPAGGGGGGGGVRGGGESLIKDLKLVARACRVMLVCLGFALVPLAVPVPNMGVLILYKKNYNKGRSVN